jgi:two-component system OmpR family response regulator
VPYLNRNLKISVVEDNKAMSEMIRDYLSSKFTNAEISVYNTGEEALSSIKTEPDVIILDYNLDTENPKALNGIQILMKLKDRFKTPVIFLSAQERADVSANTIKYGAFDYIVKNEAAFNRLEIVINNIMGHTDMKKTLGTQKFFNTILIVLMIILIAGFVLMKMH